MNVKQARRSLALVAAALVGSGLAGGGAVASAAPAARGVDAEWVTIGPDMDINGRARFDPGGPNEYFQVCDTKADGISIKGQIKWAGQPAITMGDPTHGQNGCATMNLRLPEGKVVWIRINDMGPDTPPQGYWSEWTRGRA